MSQINDIKNIAKKLNFEDTDFFQYGDDKAKIHFRAIEKAKNKKKGKLILVSAITPTPAGEGKTTTTIALGQGLNKINKNVSIALREPSMGPLFGVKGGATGGGRSIIIPSTDINFNFTGDFAAITSAHNLLAAAMDNAIFQRQLKDLDPRQITFKRVMDMNDRALRNITIGLGGTSMGVPRETGFDITAASEIMAILCLSKDYEDLKKRINNILLGLTYEGMPVKAESLKVSGAMTVVLKDAIHPNLVQSIEGVPTFIHGGPFANIAHGTNSILATNMALLHSDYVVTEAGFAFDLGGEKYLDIACRAGDFYPSLCVIVATVRALKMHGGISLKNLNENNPKAVERGFSNLEKHIENVRKFNLPVLVAINKFASDSQEEIDIILSKCKNINVDCALNEGFEKGGEGAITLAEKASELCDKNTNQTPKHLYEYEWIPAKKIETISKEIYGAIHIDYSQEAKSDLKKIYSLGYENLAVCMAKTQKSLSDNPKLLGRPENFTMMVRKIEIAAGAGFIVPITGDMMRMPGLPERPAFENMDIDSSGVVKGVT